MKKEHKKAVKILLLFVVLAVISSGLTKIAYITYDKLTVYRVQKFDAKFEIVSSGAGLAADPNVLNFGAVTSGGSSTKQIVLYQNYTQPLKVKFVYSGSIAAVLTPIEPFYLEPNKEVKISITAHAYTRIPTKYNGTVTVLFLKQ